MMTSEIDKDISQIVTNGGYTHGRRGFIKHNKVKRRVVTKSGRFNLENRKTSGIHVFPDIIAIFIKARWRWTLTYCVFTYIVIWLFFSGIWWAILYMHDDLQQENLPYASNYTERTPCVREIYGFTSIFLFSIEIHTALGYGKRVITMECPAAIFTMCIESILGTIIQSLVIGIIFAKLTRPKNRAHTILFSRNAIINLRDGKLCFIFRIGNIRKSRIIAVKVHAFLIRCVTNAGDKPINEQIELKLAVDDCEDTSFKFPISAVHIINKNSPFYTLSASNMLKSELEILVVFEGIIESTGQPVQAKSSYITNEILWGHRFSPVIEYRNDIRKYVVDYSKFNETLRVNTPLRAAKEMKYFYKVIENIGKLQAS